jgi:hypothetical protein
MKKKILIANPFSGIWLHSLPEAYLINHLSSEYEIYKLVCDGIFQEHCTVMESCGIKIEDNCKIKNKICKDCKITNKLLVNNFKFTSINIVDFISNEDKITIDKLLTNFNFTEIINFKIEDIEIGKISLYEILLKFKKTNFEFNEYEEKYFRQYFKSTLLSYFAIKRIMKVINFNFIISYSPQYSIPGICLAYANKIGLKTYFIEGSSNIFDRYKSVRIWNWDKYGLVNPALRFWKNRNLFKLSNKSYSKAYKHAKALIEGTSFSVYSEPPNGVFDIFEYYKIPKNTKILLATMSSYDEVFSAFVINKFPKSKYVSTVYNNQFEWILDTINFVSTIENVYLIVRVHPRTFSNKRENVISKESNDLINIFNNLPDNVKINWPSEKISLYDMLPQVYTLVTAWSATSIEALYFGIPVVSYDQNLPSFPNDIHYTGTSKFEYYNNINKVLNENKNRGLNTKNALDWWAFNSFGVINHPSFVRDKLNDNFGKNGLKAFYILNKFFKIFICFIEVKYFKFFKIGHTEINNIISNNFDSIFEIKTEE